MAINKTNDWLIASLVSPDATLGDFRQEGLTSDNTELKDKATYLANEKIKNNFKDENGKFNQKAFDDFYDMASITYNKFANDDFDETTLKEGYFFKEDTFRPKGAKVITQESVIKRIANPFKSMTGFIGNNLNINNSGLSIREIAQNNEVKDSSGKGLGWTPNDDSARGMFDFWTKPTTALAQWDDDGNHQDMMTGQIKKHKKGEFKTNENGDYYYETLDGRDPSNRVVLSVWDTNTKEGTWANKIDFMDSDGIDKSIVGSIAKAAALSAPAFIPGFGKWYTAALMGKELLDVLPSTAKAIGSLLGYDPSEFKALDKSRALSRRLTTSVSDYSKANMFTTENVTNMLSDVFLQLSQQKLLAEIPFNFGMNKAEKEAIKLAKEKYGDQVITDLLKSSSFNTMDKQTRLEMLNSIPGLSSVIDKYVKLGTKGGQYLSTAYMAGTSAIGVVDESKNLGLDDRDTGAMLLGLTIGYGAMMRKFQVGHWVEKGLGMDDLDRSIRGAIKKAIGEYADDILKVKGGENSNGMFRIGKRIGSYLSDKLENANPYVIASLAEGTEEVTEEVMSDSLKVAYNSLNSLGLTSTKDKQFSFTPEDIMSRYLMNFMGGAAGGAIFKLNENFSKRAIKNNPEELNKDIAYFVRNGYTDRLLSEIDKQEKNGLFGSKNLSLELENDQEGLNEGTLNYKATSNESESHNTFVANLLRQEIGYIDSIIKQENVPSDTFINDIYSQRAGRMVDLGLNSSIRDDLKELTSKLIQKRIDVDKATDEKSPNLIALNNELGEIRKEINAIASGDKFDYYYQQALFSMNDAINRSYGVMTLNDFSKQKYGKNINEFEEESDEWKDIEQAYQEYIKNPTRKQSIKEGFVNFEEDLNKVSKSSKLLNDFGNQVFGYYDNVQDIVGEIEALQQPVGEIDNIKEALKAKFIDKNSYDVNKISQILSTNTYVDPEFKNIIDSTFKKIGKEEFLYQSIENEELKNTLLQFQDLGIQSEFDEDYDDYDFTDNINESMRLINDFINKYDLNSTNIESFKNDLKEYLLNDKEFNRQYSRSNEYDSFFGDLAWRNIDDIVDSITNQLLSKNQELNNLSIQYNNLLKQLESKSKNNPLYELLKTMSIEIEGQDSVTPIEVLQNQLSIFNNLNNPDEYVIDNKITSDQLKASIKAIDRLQSAIYSLTDYSYRPDGFSASDIYGFGNAINYLLEKDGQAKKYDLLTTRSNAAIFGQLEQIKAKLNFLKSLSDYNDDNKIANFKAAGIVVNGMMLKSIEYGGELYNSLLDLDIKLDNVSEIFESSTNVKKVFDSIDDDNVKLDINDDFIAKFETEKTNIESELYKSISKKLNEVSDKDQFVSSITKSIINTFSSNDFINLINKNTTEFNRFSKSIEPMDKLTYLLSIMFSDSLEFYNKLRGGDALEKSVFAPFSAQEHSVRIAYAMINNNQPFNEALKNAMVKANEYAISHSDNDIKTACDDFCKTIKGLTSSIFINGVPGAGKTSCVIDNIVRMSEKAAIFGPTNEQGENINSSLTDNSNILNKDFGKSKRDLFETLIGKDNYNLLIQKQNELHGDLGNEIISPTDKTSQNAITFKLNPNSDFFKSLSSIKKIEINGNIPNVIVIDEATHVSKFEYEILREVVKNHNKNNAERVTLVLTGDTEQNGFTTISDDQELALNINEIFTYHAPQLSQSIRTAYNIKTRNIDTIRAFKKEVKNNILNNNSVRFKDISEYFTSIELKIHYDESNNLIGDKFVENITINDINKIVSYNTGGKIGVIVDDKVNSNIINMISSIPDYENIFDIKTPLEVQGKEYDYVIIDIDNSLPKQNSSSDEAFIYITKLYTAISRSRNGSIVNSKLIKDINVNNVTGEIIPSKTSLSSNKIEEFKEFRINTVNNILSGYSAKPEEFTEDTTTFTTEPKTTEVLPDEVIDSSIISSAFEDFNKLPEKQSDDAVDMRSYASYERLGVEINNDVVSKVISNSEDLPAVYYTINDKVIINKSLSSDDVFKARSELRKIVTAFITKSQYKDEELGIEQSISDILKNYQKIDTKLFEKLDFDNFKLGVRVKPYTKSDRRHDAYYNKAKELADGKKVPFLIAEIPVKDSDKTVKITLAALVDENNPNIPNNVKQALSNFYERYNELAVDNKDVTLYIKEKYYDYILNPQASLIPTGLFKKSDDGTVLLDSNKKPTSVQENLTEFRKKHQNLKISPVYIYTGREIEMYDRIPVKSGRAFVLVTANKTHNDLLHEYEMQVKKESQIVKSGGNLSSFKRDIKLMPLNDYGANFSEWYDNNKSIFLSDDSSRLMKVYSGKYIGIRIRNSLLSFFKEGLLSTDNFKKAKFSDIELVSSNGKSIEDFISSLFKSPNFGALKMKYKLDKFSDNEIKFFIKEIHYSLIYMNSAINKDKNVIQISNDSLAMLHKTDNKYAEKVNSDSSKLSFETPVVINDEYGFSFVRSFVNSLESSPYNVNKNNEPDRYENRMNLLKDMYQSIFSNDFPNGIYYNASIYDKTVKDPDHWALLADEAYGKFNVNFEVQLPFVHVRSDMFTDTVSDIIDLDGDEIEEFDNYINSLDITEFYVKSNNKYKELKSLLSDDLIKLNDAKSQLLDTVQKETEEIEKIQSGVHSINNETNVDINELIDSDINFSDYNKNVFHDDGKSITNNFTLIYTNDDNEIFAKFVFENGNLISKTINNIEANAEDVDITKLRSDSEVLFNELLANHNIERNVERIKNFYNEIFDAGSMLLAKEFVKSNDITNDIIRVISSDIKEKQKFVELLNDLNNILEC